MHTRQSAPFRDVTVTARVLIPVMVLVPEAGGGLEINGSNYSTEDLKAIAMALTENAQVRRYRVVPRAFAGKI